MAKGNMFLGMARGKVGDVVFSRADGEQISRVRNRHPKNPRTNPQLFQRAIMATVVLAYTAGKEIFNHSFQGYSVGAQNQREFIKRNAKLLREIIAADINTPITTNSQIGRVVAPGVSTPACNPFVISAGSYAQNLFTFASNAFHLPEPQNGETVKHYAERINLISGDIYTLVLFVPKKQVVYQSNLWDDVLASQPYVDFMFVRFIVKSDLTAETPLIKLSSIFDIEVGGNGVKTAEEIGDLTMMDGLAPLVIASDTSAILTTGAYGIIRSRRDQDLRSDSVLHVNYGNTAENMFGIASDYLLDAWRTGTTPIGDSDLILEGGDV